MGPARFHCATLLYGNITYLVFVILCNHFYYLIVFISIVFSKQYISIVNNIYSNSISACHLATVFRFETIDLLKKQEKSCRLEGHLNYNCRLENFFIFNILIIIFT